MIRPRPWLPKPPSPDHAGWEQLWPELAAAGALEHDPTGAIRDDAYDLLKRVGVFSALIPAEQGGYGLDPLSALTLIEDISSASGTLGWLAFVGVTGGMFSVELPPLGAGMAGAFS